MEIPWALGLMTKESMSIAFLFGFDWLADLKSMLIQDCKRISFLVLENLSNVGFWENSIKTSGSDIATVFGSCSNNWVNNVEPHLPVFDRTTNFVLGGGSPTFPASLMNDSSGIRTRCVQWLN